MNRPRSYYCKKPTTEMNGRYYPTKLPYTTLITTFSTCFNREKLVTKFNVRQRNSLFFKETLCFVSKENLFVSLW